MLLVAFSHTDLAGGAATLFRCRGPNSTDCPNFGGFHLLAQVNFGRIRGPAELALDPVSITALLSRPSAATILRIFPPAANPGSLLPARSPALRRVRRSAGICPGRSPSSTMGAGC